MTELREPAAEHTALPRNLCVDLYNDGLEIASRARASNLAAEIGAFELGRNIRLAGWRLENDAALR